MVGLQKQDGTITELIGLLAPELIGGIHFVACEVS